jgi:hypothetical protein
MSETVWQLLHKWVMADDDNVVLISQHDGILEIRLSYYPPDAESAHMIRAFTQREQRDPEFMLRAMQQRLREFYEFIRRRDLVSQDTDRG